MGRRRPFGRLIEVWDLHKFLGIVAGSFVGIFFLTYALVCVYL